MGLTQCPGHLRENVNNALRGLRSDDRHDFLECGAVEELHRVVKDAVWYVAVVEDRHCVRVGQLRGELHLALELRQILSAEPVGSKELDRRRAAEHRVARAIHHAHAALAQLFFQEVLPELARYAHVAAQPVDDA